MTGADLVQSPTGLDRALDFWARPIRSQLAVCADTREKPLGEMTVPDLIAWASVFAYVGATEAVLITMAVNLLGNAFGLRRQR